MNRSSPNRETASVARSAFTLVELLVVVSIILILAAVTAATINITIDGDKVRAGARQVQSYLEGARSRAVYAKEQRGVRFLLEPSDTLDPTGPRTVSSMIYIQPTDPWVALNVILERPDIDNDGIPAWGDSNDPMNPANAANYASYGFSKPFPLMDDPDNVFVVRGFDGVAPGQGSPDPTFWLDLYSRGLIRDGNYLEFLDGSGKYAIDTRLLTAPLPYGPGPDGVNGTPQIRLLLQTKYRNPASTPAGVVAAEASPPTYKYTRCKLYLTPSPLANQQPVQLPKGVVINLDRGSSDPDGKFQAGALFQTALLRGDRLPNSWKIPVKLGFPALLLPLPPQHPTGFVYSQFCDIMFSPRGTVDGPEASAGLIHLYVGEQKDADRDRLDWATAAPGSGKSWSAPEMQAGLTASDPTGNPYQRGDKIIVSIFARTGRVMSSPIFIDSAGNELAGQRFRYSETGEVAGK